MININANVCERMKHFVLIAALIASTLEGCAFAQETAAGGQAAPSENASGGQLAPPPDNAPAAPPNDSKPDISKSTAESSSAKSGAAVTGTINSREQRQIRQQEIIRRQELIFRADESLKAARKAEVATQYPEARKDYLFSAEAYSTVSRSTDSYAASAEGLTRVDLQLYDDALKIGDTVRAKKLVDEILKYNPNNKLAQEKREAINRALADPNDTTTLGNPAVTPSLVKKVDTVQKLFAEAEQFRRTGQWDEATARLKRILGMDPYNITATKELERIDAQKVKYDDHARDETRDERLRQVEEKWFEPITNRDTSSQAQESQPSLLRTTNFNLDQKLRNIFLSLDFNNATIEEATNFLSIESKRLDPDHKGVNFIIQPEASTSAKPVSISLNNVPLNEALRYVCQLANVKFKVQDYAISIVPFGQITDDLISRTFVVAPNFVVPPAAAGEISSATAALTSARPIAVTPSSTRDTTASASEDGNTVRAALLAKGVKFPPGASAVYTPTTGQLTVVNTADQMELIEELVNAGQAPTLMVRIATKFVEINQSDLNDLTINTAFNFFSPPLNRFGDVTTPSFATQLPGSLAISPNNVDQLISPQTSSPNTLALRGFYNLYQYNLIITALSQKSSFDLLSEPTVTTKSGEQGVLEAVRVFPYPISFDPPTLITQTTNSTTSTIFFNTATPPTVVATTPTDFKRRNVGVRLVIKPQVAADNKTVELALFPEVTEFSGFINYGSPIYVANPGGGRSLLSLNQINQPVFNTRRVNTKVQVRDGSTVVLGGLIRDDIQNINDKVPLLGDLPLVGRLFQSKAVRNTKRNLIIFVSANIYRNDGELLNPPDTATATADILTGQAGFTSHTAQ